MLLTTADLKRALPLWAGLDGAEVSLINHSENQTFALTSKAGERFCLRVHRPGYHVRAAVESELAWLAAVRRDTMVTVPEVVPGKDGLALQPIVVDTGQTFLSVLFRFIPGVEPSLTENPVPLFATLGRYAASLHNHASTWHQPPGFERPIWNASTILTCDGLWGDWRTTPGVGEDDLPVLQQLEEALRKQLAAYGTASRRFGLIHADMRLGNLLLHERDLALLDFDDCGFGWFTYDFAAALSFYEAHPAAPKLLAAWLGGYRQIRHLEDADISSIEAMVMLRRMALLAWIGSHAETRLAQTHSPGFAEASVRLAKNYLTGTLWPDA